MRLEVRLVDIKSWIYVTAAYMMWASDSRCLIMTIRMEQTQDRHKGDPTLISGCCKVWTISERAGTLPRHNCNHLKWRDHDIVAQARFLQLRLVKIEIKINLVSIFFWKNSLNGIINLQLDTKILRLVLICAVMWHIRFKNVNKTPGTKG